MACLEENDEPVAYYVVDTDYESFSVLYHCKVFEFWDHQVHKSK